MFESPFVTIIRQVKTNSDPFSRTILQTSDQIPFLNSQKLIRILKPSEKREIRKFIDDRTEERRSHVFLRLPFVDTLVRDGVAVLLDVLWLHVRHVYPAGSAFAVGNPER